MVQTQNSWYWDEPFFLGGSKGTQRELSSKRCCATFRAPDNYLLNPYKENWGSPHIAGVLFLVLAMAHCPWDDAIARSIRRLFSALLTPDGGEGG